MRALAVGVVGVLVLAGCGSDSNTASESSDDEVSLLFVQDADGGNLDDGHLTMIEVSPNTGWFTDRPVREAGQMATADFVSLWAEGGTFAVDPPNADFACQVDGATVNVVVELSSPVVNGRTLTYDTVRVGDTPDGNYDCDGNAHLFIDSVGDACARAKAGSRSLQRANLAGCDLSKANLKRANLTLADLKRANLILADLNDANLILADLDGANLTGADLTAADLDRREPERRGPERREPEQRGPGRREPDQRGPDRREPDRRETERREPERREPDQRGPDQRGPDRHEPDRRVGLGHRERQRHDHRPRQGHRRPGLTQR